MSCCPGCSPIFQDGQMAHMMPGGCMYADYDEIISVSSEDNDSFESDRSVLCATMTTPDSGVSIDPSASEDTDVECCICYEIIGEKNNCVTECGHKFCFKCLAMAMTRSNACPCCRSPLTNEPVKNEIVDEEEDDEGDEDYQENADNIVYDDDDDDDDLSEYVEGAHSRWPDVSLTVPAEIIAERLERNGFTILDLISLYTHHFSKTNPVYTDLHIQHLYKKCDDIVGDADNEHKENAEFALEDYRAQIISS